MTYTVLRNIIDTWNILEKFQVKYELKDEQIIISTEDYNNILGSVKNPKYIKNLQVK